MLAATPYPYVSNSDLIEIRMMVFLIILKLKLNELLLIERRSQSTEQVFTSQLFQSLVIRLTLYNCEKTLAAHFLKGCAHQSWVAEGS
jgi:hypothetical protein